MDEPREDKGQEKGDDILRRMLKTPPKPHEADKDLRRPERPADGQKPEPKAD